MNRRKFNVKSLFGLLVCSVISSSVLQAQVSVRDSSLSFGIIELHAGAYVPGAQMHERFGYHFSIGPGFTYKLKNNITLGTSIEFMFGNQVKENGILSTIATEDGFLINQSGQPAVVNLFMRGYRGAVTVGKIFPWFGPNVNSGLDARFGVGYIQHNILIKDEDRNTPQVMGEYRKGYDRMTSGVLFHQYLGYTNFSNNQRVSFSIGLVFSEALTKNRRSWNYDVNGPLDQQRLDTQIGIKGVWFIPLFKRAPREFYYD